MKEFSEPIINRPTDDALVLWFTGRGSRREGTVLADLSKKGHTGTLSGGYAWKNTPLGHSVLDFDGTDGYVDVGNTTETGIKSVTLWVKPDSVSATTENPLDLNGTAYVEIANGTVTGEGFTSPSIYVNGAEAAVVTTKWCHIAITTGTGLTASDLDVGRLDAVYFGGKIDDVRVYRRELTAGEISNIYNDNKHYYGE